MPEFAPSEAKAAIAPITVSPTGLSCEAEIFLGPDAATKVATSGRIPFTSTGVSQDVHLPITMPAEGTYHVFIDVYAGGYLIAAYQAIEDVVIEVPVALPFIFSNVSAKRVVMIEAPAWGTIEFYCTITNPNDVSVTEPLKLMIAPQPSLGYYEPRLHYSFNLTLAPGQSYNFKWDGNAYRSPGVVWGPAVGDWRLCMYLEDEQGNKSAEGCV